MDFRSCVTDVQLNNALHTHAFGTTRFASKYNLADKWTIDMQDGNDYVKENGMHIIESALRVYQEQSGLKTCKFVHPSMINYGNSILPPGTGMQHGLLQACAKRLEFPLLYRAFAAKVLDKQCIDLVDFRPSAPKDQPSASSSAVSLESTSNADISVPATEALADSHEAIEEKPKSNKRRRK